MYLERHPDGSPKAFYISAMEFRRLAKELSDNEFSDRADRYYGIPFYIIPNPIRATWWRKILWWFQKWFPKG